MPLQFAPPSGVSSTTDTEPRYEAETLRKVTALAQRLQARQQETLTAAEIEQIGAEVGLDPTFVRAALEQVTAAEAAAAAKVAPTKRQQDVLTVTDLQVRPASSFGETVHRTLGAVTASWWAAGWTIPFLVHGGSSGFFGGWGMYVGVGVFLSALTGHDQKERRAKRIRRVAQDPHLIMHSRAAMLETVFALQSQLERQKEHRAVLCLEVDAATAMKRGASELAVEYSFRQLSELIESVVRAQGGTVYSNSGDRVIAVFPEDAAAVRAAREIQTALPTLNGERNRLGQPFTLRYGLSAGEVAADASALLHSTVLNRAAALRDAAAPGEIVLSGELTAAGLLELGNLTPHREAIQGKPAFVYSDGLR